MSIYELVFHTTSGASRSGPPSTYLNVFTVYIIWVNYNNSLTWNKVIWGYFPLLTMIIARSQWGRYNLPIMYKKDSVSTPPGMDGTISLPVTKKHLWRKRMWGETARHFNPIFTANDPRGHYCIFALVRLWKNPPNILEQSGVCPKV